MSVFVQPAAIEESTKSPNYGMYAGSAKLTEDQVKAFLLAITENGQIKDEINRDFMYETASEYGVSVRTLEHIVMGVSWRHVLPEIERLHSSMTVPKYEKKPTTKQVKQAAVKWTTFEVPEAVLSILLNRAWAIDLPSFKKLLSLPIKPRTVVGWEALVAAYKDADLSNGGESWRL